MTKEYTANTDNVIVTEQPRHAYPWTIRLSDAGMAALTGMLASADRRSNTAMKNEVADAIWAEWDKEEIA